jgi:methylphosphotriester-DNA--protein-cysteine methyltransferase
VARLFRRGLLVRDPVVGAVLRGDVDPRSMRTAQRHVLRATGVPHRAIVQIERARLATQLLRAGVSILDVVHEAGYYDQAHLTRSLSRRIGQTPLQIARGIAQLSYLYKTTPLR